MRKFLKKLIFYLAVTLAVCFIPAVLMDPFNVFHPLNARSNGVEPNRNFIKTSYVLANPDRFDAFLFGSSHVAMLDVGKMPGRCYNMYYSGGIPSEHAANIKTFVENGVIPEHIYIGLDNISLSATYEEHTKEQLRAPYEYYKAHPLEFFMLYLDPVVNLKSAVWLYRNNGTAAFQAMDKEFYSNGGAVLYGIDSEINPEEAKISCHNSYDAMLRYLSAAEYPATAANHESVIDAVASIAEICEKNGIELTVFVNPMYFEQFQYSVMNEAFLSLLRKLADVTPYYSFCGYNKYTTDYNLYYFDHQHYLAEMGDLMIDAFAYGKVDPEAYAQGFGIKVTKDNVEDLISLITNPDAGW